MPLNLDINHLKNRASTLAEDELIIIAFTNSPEYHPDAVEVAKEELGRRGYALRQREDEVVWEKVGCAPPTIPSDQNEPDNPPNKQLAEMMKETLRRYREMSPEEKKAYWERVVPNPRPFLTGTHQEGISPFSGLPLSELDRLGLPRPNYDLALRNTALLMTWYDDLMKKGYSHEEAKEKLKSRAAELLNPQSRLNQETQVYQALRSQGLSHEEAMLELKRRQVMSQ